MSEIGGVQGVLAQIRAMQGQIGAAGNATAATPAAAPRGAGFGEALTHAIDQVSDTQNQAARLAESFERGDRNASLVEVMLAMQKAQVSFKAVTEVRNRLVQAYQDIQNMPI